MKLPAKFDIEEKLWSFGINYIAGADEVGRGAWAGPVVAAAVIFPKKVRFPEDLFDSKKLSPNRREYLANLIYDSALSVGVGCVSASVISKFGIGMATHKAFRASVTNLSVSPEKILVDAFYIKRLSKNIQVPIKKGDEICASISAASIIAKVYRDSIMRSLARKYPEYGFDRNKGYGTSFHQNAIRMNNFVKIHRTSFNIGYLIQ